MVTLMTSREKQGTVGARERPMLSPLSLAQPAHSLLGHLLLNHLFVSAQTRQATEATMAFPDVQGPVQ